MAIFRKIFVSIQLGAKVTCLNTTKCWESNFGEIFVSEELLRYQMLQGWKTLLSRRILVVSPLLPKFFPTLVIARMAKLASSSCFRSASSCFELRCFQLLRFGLQPTEPQETLNKKKEILKNSSRFLAPKVLVGHLGRDEHSSERAIGFQVEATAAG